MFSNKAGRPKTTPRLSVERLDQRALPATLAPIPDINIVPERTGYQVPLDGGTGNNQTYTVTSDNPSIVSTVAQGRFLTINVTHDDSDNSKDFTGALVFQFFEDLTPDTVAHIATLVEQGFYTNKIFHRVANNFGFPLPAPDGYIVQGGSFNGNGTDTGFSQPGFPFPDEFSQQLAFTNNRLNDDTSSIYGVAGQLAMANAGDDTNSTQFFITTENPRNLDYNHTIFAQLVSGADILTKMTQVTLNGTTPAQNITITSATLSNVNPDGVVHLNATGAKAGQTANITVTATDTVDGSTTSDTFQVTITNNTQNAKPFISPAIQNQVVGTIQTTPTIQGQTSVFQVPFVNTNGPTAGVAFRVAGDIVNNAFTQVANATATVDANGVVRVVPNAGFTGVINLIVGVRSATATDVVDSYDTQRLTLTVQNGTPEINLAPIASPGSGTAIVNTPTTFQLQGNTANPNSQQTLTFNIVTAPTNGTINNFDATTGSFVYTPNPEFQGTDTLQFTVTDVGAPTPNLSSATATFTILVQGGNTGAVRLIGRYLVVSAPARKDSVPNSILVTQNENRIQVFVDGLLDSTQPTVDSLDRIVVYGSKSNDRIQIAPGITVPATLDGGRGGINRLIAAAGDTVSHVWFGKNKVQIGTARDAVIGRRRTFSLAPTEDGDAHDKVFVGDPRMMTSLHKIGIKPGGRLFRFVNGHLVAVDTPRALGPRFNSIRFAPPGALLDDEGTS